MGDLEKVIKEATFAHILGFGLFLAFIYYMVAFDDGSKLERIIQSERGQLEKDQSMMKSIEKAMKDKVMFNQQISEMVSHMQEFQEYFSSSYSSNELMEQFSILCEKNQLSIIEAQSVDTDEEFKNYKEIGMKFTVEGRFEEIMSFISQVTHLKRAMDFRNIIIKAPNEGDFLRIQLKSVLVFYSKKRKIESESSNEPSNES